MVESDIRPGPVPKSQSVEIYLSEYYFARGWWYAPLRILGGPLIIYWGFIFYTDGADRQLLAYSGFMIAFGVYYLLKPCLALLFSKTWYTNLHATYRIEATTITVALDGVHSELAIRKIRDIREENLYFAVQLPRNQNLYIPKHTARVELIDGLRALRKQLNGAE